MIIYENMIKNIIKVFSNNKDNTNNKDDKNKYNNKKLILLWYKIKIFFNNIIRRILLKNTLK